MSNQSLHSAFDSLCVGNYALRRMPASHDYKLCPKVPRSYMQTFYGIEDSWHLLICIEDTGREKFLVFLITFHVPL